MIAFVKTRSGLQVYDKEGNVYVINQESPFFEAISNLVLDTDKTFEDFFQVYEAKTTPNILKKMLGDNLQILMDENDGKAVVKYKDLELPEKLQERLLNTVDKMNVSVLEFLSADNSDLSELNPILNFVENLMLNSSHSSVAELYDFLDACNLPITSDGYFLAYKKVRFDYKDIYSGTFDNSVGMAPRMERWQVDDNRHQTCSVGLHCCSYDYLEHYGSTTKDSHRVVVVKVNPRDVVSVPSDYNNQKMRVSSYKVIDEIPNSSHGKIVPYYISPAIEGKLWSLTNSLVQVFLDIAKKFHLPMENENDIDFNSPLYVVPIAEEDFEKSSIDMLQNTFHLNTELLDIQDFLQEVEGEVSINGFIDYLASRIK